MPAIAPVRPTVLALGLFLPLAASGAASAQSSAWVDPPARPAAQDAAGSATSTPRKEAVDAKAAQQDEGLPKATVEGAAGPARATALRRPAGRIAISPAAAHPHRLAETPAAGGAPAGAERAAAARSLAARYLAAVSGPGAAMVGAAPRFYGARVRFYGRATTLAGLIAEKRSFVRRWPERRYEPRAIRTACDSETCTVRTIVDFRAADPTRGAVSSGAAELVLEVRFSGPHPVIVAETGRVLRRDAQAGALAPAPGKA